MKNWRKRLFFYILSATCHMKYNQSQIVNILVNEGYDVTTRTLRYWRDNNIIPPLLHSSEGYYYTLRELDVIRNQCNLSGRKFNNYIGYYELEGRRFIVYKLEIIKNHLYEYTLYTNCGIICLTLSKLINIITEGNNA